MVQFNGEDRNPKDITATELQSTTNPDDVINFIKEYIYIDDFIGLKDERLFAIFSRPDANLILSNIGDTVTLDKNPLSGAKSLRTDKFFAYINEAYIQFLFHELGKKVQNEIEEDTDLAVIKQNIANFFKMISIGNRRLSQGEKITVLDAVNNNFSTFKPFFVNIGKGKEAAAEEEKPEFNQLLAKYGLIHAIILLLYQSEGKRLFSDDTFRENASNLDKAISAGIESIKDQNLLLSKISITLEEKELVTLENVYSEIFKEKFEQLIDTISPIETRDISEAPRLEQLTDLVYLHACKHFLDNLEEFTALLTMHFDKFIDLYNSVIEGVYGPETTEFNNDILERVEILKISDGLNEKLGGYVEPDSIYEALNEYLQGSCKHNSNSSDYTQTDKKAVTEFIKNNIEHISDKLKEQFHTTENGSFFILSTEELKEVVQGFILSLESPEIDNVPDILIPSPLFEQTRTSCIESMRLEYEGMASAML